MKKILLFLFLTFSLLNINYIFANDSRNQYIEDCSWVNSGKCIDQPNFVIKTWDISPWITADWNTSSEIANWALWTIIQKMMLALWFLSVFIMTIWAWYIVLHNWQDELLSKWKTIFMSWIYSMIIALSSYYLVAIVRFLLYSSGN